MPGQGRYRDVTAMHTDCGKAQKAEIAYFNKAGSGDKTNWHALVAEAPAHASQLRKQSLILADGDGAPQSRNFQQVTTLMKVWFRKKSLDMEQITVEMDKRNYFKHMRSLKYKRSAIKAKWAKLTSDDRIAAKKAIKKGKKLYAWVQMPRQLVSKDGVHLEIHGPPTQEQVPTADAENLLQGRDEIDMDINADAFGGVSLLHFYYMFLYYLYCISTISSVSLLSLLYLYYISLVVRFVAAGLKVPSFAELV